MPDTATLTIRVPKADLERLTRLADAMKRSKSFLAGQALAQYLDYESWFTDRVQAGIDEADSGVGMVRHEKVAEWVGSWGTDHELPMPE
jgi:predicted transcriptional regulator